MTTPVLPLGAMVWLANYMIDVHVKERQTFPDTPNLYSADLKVVGDQGGMDLSALAGRRGRDGQPMFQTRLMKEPVIDDPADLPTTLQDTPYDLGKYWLIDELDANGHVVGQWAWMWYGSSHAATAPAPRGYRKLMCGYTGDPGPVPAIEPHVTLIEPQEHPTYPDTTSHVATHGTHLRPSWDFRLAVPAGPAGAAGPVASMPDVDLSTPPLVNELLCCTDRKTSDGQPIFAPITLRNYQPRPYSVPEGDFIAYSGVAQRQPIGSFTVPDPGFDWTPIVWGHLGGPVSAPIATINTIQHVVVSAWAGTYRLRINGTPTNPIAVGADNAQIQAAIEGVVGAGNAVVSTGIQHMSYQVEFVGALAATNVPVMTADTAGLIPTGISGVVITVWQQGGTLGTTVEQQLTGAPVKVGCQVLLGDPVTGLMLSKGKGNLHGHVNVMPHYSTPGNMSQNITPINGYAVVPAGATAAERTVHFNLWNEGFLGHYDFKPGNAQMFVLVNPINATDSMYAYPAVVTRRRRQARGVAARRGRR